MSNNLPLENLLTEKDWNRRNFISAAGMSVVAGTLLSGNTMAQLPAKKSSGMAEKPEPVPTPPQHHPTEAKNAPAPAPLAPDRRVGFALVGLGKLTLEQLMPAFGQCKYAKPVALVSGDAGKAKKVAGQYGINPASIYNYTNFDTIANNPEVEVVYIVLPNSMHAEFTIRAAKAGKHVLCEKPLATSVADASRMVDACNKAGKWLMTAYRIQYEPHNKMAREWLLQKKHGTVKLLESTNVQNIGDPNQWRLKKSLAGGGPLPDLGVYCINTLRYLTASEPVWVLATQHDNPSDNRFKEVEETVMWQMGFPDGTIASCTTSYSVHDSKRYRAFTDIGAWFGMDSAFAYSGLKLELAKVEDGTEWKQQPNLPQKYQFALEMDHMAECVLQNKKPFTPGEEGLQDCRIVEAIYESARTGKKVTMNPPTTPDAFRGTVPV